MEERETVHVNATLETLPELLSWVHRVVAKAQWSKTQAMQFELVLEEAIVNVVMHAYARRGGPLEIEAVLISQESLTFILTDQGEAFDPLSAPLKEPVPEDEVVEGGLGVKLMRLYCDSLHYQRIGHCNQLTLSKSIISSSQ